MHSIEPVTDCTQVKFLSNLLKFEFIYQPAPDITFNFDEAINYLSTKGTLLVEQRDGKEVICVPLHKVNPANLSSWY